jgi:hypothetical protein
VDPPAIGARRADRGFVRRRPKRPTTNNGQMGAMALTDQQLIFVGDLMRFNRAELSLPLRSINSVKQFQQMMFWMTRITTNSATYDFAKLTESFKTMVESARATAAAPPPPPPSVTVRASSVADELPS